MAYVQESCPHCLYASYWRTLIYVAQSYTIVDWRKKAGKVENAEVVVFGQEGHEVKEVDHSVYTSFTVGC